MATPKAPEMQMPPEKAYSVLHREKRTADTNGMLDTGGWAQTPSTGKIVASIFQESQMLTRLAVCFVNWKDSMPQEGREGR